LRSHLAARLERREPPVLVVVTHIDQLRPSQEWNPPYDLLDKDNAKAISISEAVQVVAAELGAPVQSVVPVCLDDKRGHYNVDVLWAKMLDVMPEAHGARIVRVLAAAGNQASWRRIWSQAVNAGRVIGRTLTK
jgi:predicted GTPase